MERPVRNPEAAQSVDALEKLAFAWNGADYQMGMRQVGGKKRFCNLDGCVAGLDDLLGKGKVFANEDVQVRRMVLGEFHGLLLCFITSLNSML